MDTTKSPYVLQNLLYCENCGSPISAVAGQHRNLDVYRCTRFNATPENPCAAPDVRATPFEAWLIQEITDVVFTPWNVRLLQMQLAEAAGNDPIPDRPTATELAKDPLTYFAKEARPLAKRALGNFINKITIHGATAAVHYSLPLPDDSSLPGEELQTVNMPAEFII